MLKGTSKEYAIQRLFQQAKKGNRVSYIDAMLMKYTADFNMADWRAVRAGKFFEISDQLETPIEKKQFLLRRVKEYLGK